jgi:hypothetical protein
MLDVQAAPSLCYRIGSKIAWPICHSLKCVANFAWTSAELMYPTAVSCISLGL